MGGAASLTIRYCPSGTMAFIEYCHLNHLKQWYWSWEDHGCLHNKTPSSQTLLGARRSVLRRLSHKLVSNAAVEFHIARASEMKRPQLYKYHFVHFG